MNNADYGRLNLYFRKDNEEHREAYKMIANIKRGERADIIAKALLAYEKSGSVSENANNDDLRAIIREELAKINMPVMKQTDNVSTSELKSIHVVRPVEKQAVKEVKPDMGNLQDAHEVETQEDDDDDASLMLNGLSIFTN
jgi:hypothetical protein